MADNKFLQALGEITAEASALEYCVAYLVTVARGEDKTQVAATLKRVGGARQELLKLCEETRVAKGKNDQLYKDLVRLEQRMSKALWERNRLVHAVEVLRLTDHLLDPELALWHPKTDTDLSVSDTEMKRLVQELRGVAGTALRTTHQFPTSTEGSAS